MLFLRLFGLLCMSIALSTTAFAVTTSAQANATKKLCDFAPINNQKIPVGAVNPLTGKLSGITQSQFNASIKKIMTVYSPIVKAQGATLVFNNLWTDATVNSDAYQSGNTWYVDAYGGLARYKSMTPDAMTFVFCHEMGHHLGGFPRFDGDWASVEGQADYFAAMKCFRRVYENDDNISVVSKTTIPPEVVAGCSAQFTDAKSIALCERSSEVSLILADVLYDLGKGGGSEPAVGPSFATPTTATVTVTNGDHPLAQCRLDTYFNGSICPVDYWVDFGITDATTGACSQEKGDPVGYRPTCWYAPSH